MVDVVGERLLFCCTTVLLLDHSSSISSYVFFASPDRIVKSFVRQTGFFSCVDASPSRLVTQKKSIITTFIIGAWFFYE